MPCRILRPPKWARPAGGRNQQGVIFTPDGQYILGQNYEEGELAAYQVTPTGLQDTGWRLPITGAFPAAITRAPALLHR